MRLRFAADVRRSEIDNGKISERENRRDGADVSAEIRVPCFASDSSDYSRIGER